MTPEPDTRERILDTAFSLFLVEGYEKVTMDRVAKAAGVSKGGLFHHFSSKYELAKLSLIAGLEKAFGEGLHTKVQRMRSPRSRVKALIDVSVDNFTASSQLLFFIVEVYEEGLRLGDGMGEWKEFYAMFLGHTEEQLEEAGVPNPKERARILMAALDGLAIQMLIMEETERDRAVARVKKELLDMMMSGAGE